MYYSFISKVKEGCHSASGRSICFEFLFWFRSAILLSKIKSLFFSLWKFAKSHMSFLKYSRLEIRLNAFHRSTISFSECRYQKKRLVEDWSVSAHHYKFTSLWNICKIEGKPFLMGNIFKLWISDIWFNENA